MRVRETIKRRKKSALIVSTLSILTILVLASILLVSTPVEATISVAHNAGCVQTSSSSKTCTITVTITAGNTALVAIEHISGTVSTIVGGGTYTQRVTKTNTVIAEIWTTSIAGASSASSVVITMSANGRFVAQALDVAGATFFGLTHTSGTTGTNPSDAQTITDANNWLFTSFSANIATTPTSGTGTLYNAGSTTGIDGGLVSNTATSITSVTTSETLASSTWAGAMLELVSVSACSRVPTIVLPSGQTSIKWTNPLATANNVAPDGQTSIVAELVVTQNGPGACNVGIQASAAFPSGVTYKWSATSTAPGTGVNVVPISPTSATTVCSAVAQASTCSIWVWSDLVNAGAQAGFNINTNIVTS